jgi:hypothetical protein
MANRSRVQSKVEENPCVHLQPRHCEARSAVAIQTAVQFSGTTKQVKRLSGLLQACGLAMTSLKVNTLHMVRFFLHFGLHPWILWSASK